MNRRLVLLSFAAWVGCTNVGLDEPSELAAHDEPVADPAPSDAPVSGLACQLGALAASCDCTENHCGQNSPVIEGVHFSKLHLGGVANDQGFSLVGIASSEANAKAGAFYPPAGDLVVGTMFKLPIGHFLVLERDTKRFLVKLVDMSTTSPGPKEAQPYWAELVGSRFPWFRLEYTTPARLDECHQNHTPCYKDVCESYPAAIDGWKAMGAFIFEGNVYNQVSISVAPSPSLPANDTWFNVACPGSLPAKMLATRRVSIDSYGASAKEQQAFANMWAGNYCGDGRVFTKANWPLKIRDTNPQGAVGSIPWVHPASFVGAFASVDAVWSSGGAVCMDTPRLDTNPILAGAPPKPYATWRAAIVAHCASLPTPRTIPRCTPGGGAGVLPAAWQASGHVISVNP